MCIFGECGLCQIQLRFEKKSPSSGFFAASLQMSEQQKQIHTDSDLRSVV